MKATWLCLEDVLAYAAIVMHSFGKGHPCIQCVEISNGNH
jgi:hypothetical protein